MVAPVNLRSRLEELIIREIEHARNGRKAHLILKANSLVDLNIIQLLYTASKAGVKVDLFIRGICCLRPGIKGVSENIRVFSMIGRYLEHSRVYYFLNNGHEEIYLGSADLMPRNLNHRVEVVFPVERESHIRYLRDQVLEAYFKDNSKTRIMHSDGTYSRAKAHDAHQIIDAQEWLMSHHTKKLV